MRTVEQTADELVEKMWLHSQCQDGAWMDKDLAIKCAIIAVDEIIQCAEDSFPNAQFFDEEVKFKKQLKHELETRLK